MTCRAFPKLELSLFAKPMPEENPKISPHELIQNNPIDPKPVTLVTHGVASLKRMTRLVIPQKSIHQFQKAFRVSVPNYFLPPPPSKRQKIFLVVYDFAKIFLVFPIQTPFKRHSSTEPTRLRFAFDSPKHSNH